MVANGHNSTRRKQTFHRRYKEERSKLHDENIISASFPISQPIIFQGIGVIGSYAKLTLMNSWKYLEYDFASSEKEAHAIEDGSYIYSKNILIDIDVSPAGRIFLTVERNIGVPASLTTMVENSMGKGGGPLIRAYPDWTWADVNDCKNIIGVYRIATDECNRLWVMDSGKVNNRLVCRPKIMAFDMTTDELVAREELPDNVVYGDNGGTHFLNILIDTVGANCAETDIYMADAEGYGLVVWNGKAFWRINSPNFEPDANAAEFNVNGVGSINLLHGIFGMAVSAEPSPLKREFYFRPLSSYSMYHVRALDLHRYRKNQTAIRYTRESFELTSRSVSQALSEGGILFFSSIDESSIVCWNRQKPFALQNTAVIAKDVVSLQWASGVKVVPKSDTRNETLWVLTNRWHRFQNNEMQFWDTNFRIFMGTVDDLIRGTVCE